MTTVPTSCRAANQRPPSARLAMCVALAAGLSTSVAAEAAQLVHSAVAAPGLVGANSIDAFDWLAEGFTLGTGATIGSVAVQALDADPAGDAGQSFTLAIYADVAGLPGLDFNAVDQGRLYSAGVLYTADGWNGVSGLNWALAPGTYWLAVEAGYGASAVSAMVLPAGALPSPKGVAYYSGSTSYALTGNADAFGLRIDSVAAVPEPTSLAMMLAGLGVAFAVKRRRVIADSSRA